jgi:uncharacterized membrane protein
MSHLIALVFDGQFKGEEARAALHRMAGEGLLEMNDTVFIARKSDGKTSVSQEDNVMGRDQKIGHVAGLIAAAVTGTMPFVLAGTLAGRLTGRLTDHGITRKCLCIVNTLLTFIEHCLLLFKSLLNVLLPSSLSSIPSSTWGTGKPESFACSRTDCLLDVRLSLAKTLGVLSFAPLTMLQACAQAVDFKIGHRFGEGQPSG